MEELEVSHETLNACGLILRWGSSSLLSLPGWALVQQNWSIGSSAEWRAGRAYPGQDGPTSNSSFYAAIL